MLLFVIFTVVRSLIFSCLSFALVVRFLSKLVISVIFCDACYFGKSCGVHVHLKVISHKLVIFYTVLPLAVFTLETDNPSKTDYPS